MTRRVLVVTGLFALYALFTAVFFREWLPHLSTSLIGPPEDNMQDFWGTYYTAAAPRAGPYFFTNLIRFPEGTPLYYHAIALPKVFVILLVTKAIGTDLPTLVLLHNLALLVSFPLSGLGAYYLARHLTGSGIAGLVAGFVFAFNPAHIMHTLHHLPFSSMEFIPFFVLAYLHALQRRSSGWLAGAVVFYALSVLSHVYYAFYLAYFIVFHTIVDMVRSRSVPTGWRLVVPVGCLVGSAVVLSPLFVPMVVAALDNPSVYAVGRGQVADLFAFAAFPPYHLLSFLGEGVYWRMTANAWEGTVYLGVANAAVVGWLLLSGKARGDRLVPYLLLGMVVFGVLSVGGRLHVLGQPTLPMPEGLLSQLPFFSNVRGPSRAIVMVYLFLAVLVGHAISLALRVRPAWSLGIAASVALLVIDFAPVHALPMTPVSCSPGLLRIGSDPEPNFGVLNLPSGRPAAYLEGNYYMLQQVCHGRPISQGTTARNVVTSLRDRLETRDFIAQRRQLTEARVKYIVLNNPRGTVFKWRDADGRREDYVRTYRLVYEDPEVTVLQVY
jgi:hypothetical protein